MVQVVAQLCLVTNMLFLFPFKITVKNYLQFEIIYKIFTINGWRQRNFLFISGAASSCLVNKSAIGPPFLSYNLNAFFLPGNVVFSKSSLNLIQGFPLISTNCFMNKN